MTTITVSASTPESVDVVVVGAGLSGLTAARDLLKSGKSVVVLEARDRVGGKVFNQPLRNGGVTEVGAEFVGPTQDKILSLISELGLETFPTYNEGNSLLWRNGTRTVYQSDPQLGGAPPVEQSSLLEIAAAQAQLDAWAAQINTSTPWKHPKAREWDGQTFEDCLIRSISHADAKLVLTTACKAIFSAEPHELSLLYIIAYIAAAGNESTVGTLGRLTAVENGAQEQRVKGGTGLIPQRLAEKVGLKHITLNAAVSRISKTYEGYTIISRAGNIHAKHVVLAMSPPLLRQIVFEPPLPSDRQWLNEKIFMPALGKGIAIYDTPFWRKNANLNAQVISDSGSVRVTFDSTPDDASFGAILGFILGDEMRAVDGNSPAQGQTKILSDYTNYFGTKAANTSEFVLYRWDLEEWSKGGPTGVAPPNVLSLYGTALRQNIDGLHFAGTETSLFWTGYMDGAVRSGQRVAQEILAQ
ncbi:hypothetical protein N0V94_008709 [Neodidymelliopsis sp. IMI 364377]|nr:hypothetical protein N0V94_008709 [Neodidymelliopsis sp. IMI 364377]